jgi:N-acylneuraminate cytidylyltransferase
MSKQIREGKITAIIPVRAGSQRVKNKSIRSFGDTNLLEHKIKQLLEIKEIDEIILTTDSKIAKDIGNKYNITVLDRDNYYASSECNNSEFFKYIAEQTDKSNNFLLYTPVTSPFVKNETIQNVIKIFLENTDYDSIVPVEILKHHMWMNNKPLNYSLENAPNTQDLPDIFALNYTCSIISREDQIKLSSLCGLKPYFYKLSQLEAIDIDTIYDFEMAQILYKNKFN